MEPPRAEARPRHFSVHGQEITDPYAWLKAENWQDGPQGPHGPARGYRRLPEGENAFAEAALAGTADLRRQLVGEMRGHPGGRERRPGARRSVRLQTPAIARAGSTR